VIIEVDIGEISIEGPPLSRRQRDELRAFVEREVIERLHRTVSGGDRSGAGPETARSPLVTDLGLPISRHILSSVAPSLPAAPVPPIGPTR
jgi:hypothetical protein